MPRLKTILVTGGAGYVGSRLVPKLLDHGYNAVVLDLYLFGSDVFDTIKNRSKLKQIKGDIRDKKTVKKAVNGCDAIIHLACISNDPSFELNPTLAKSINFDSFPYLLEQAQKAGIHRFIYASSSSVYGIKKGRDVTEYLPLKPLTDYSKYKALCEKVLLGMKKPGFTRLIFRPATVCGYSPRMRLDLTVNILTNHAINSGIITVFGGNQLRPNIHIEDMTQAYLKSLKWPSRLIDKKIYNVGYENYPVKKIATMIRNVVGKNVKIIQKPTDDERSYHISSDLIKRELGFTPTYSIEDAVLDIKKAFAQGNIPDPMTNIRYYNIKTLQALKLK
jgi:nucleoside-diphosphate-sugar epimerase